MNIFIPYTGSLERSLFRSTYILYSCAYALVLCVFFFSSAPSPSNGSEWLNFLNLHRRRGCRAQVRCMKFSAYMYVYERCKVIVFNTILYDSLSERSLPIVASTPVPILFLKCLFLFLMLPVTRKSYMYYSRTSSFYQHNSSHAPYTRA